MAADIILVNPYAEGVGGINEATVEPPLGILYIASFLEDHGFKCGVIDANVAKMAVAEVVEKIKNTSSGIVGISINVFSYQTGLKYANSIKALSKDITVIFGGAYATSLPAKCLADPNVDAIIVGEGELTMLEIMNNLRQGKHLFKGVKGVAYKDGYKLETASPRERIENLDAVPFPAYHLLSDLNIYKSRARGTPCIGIITSRGCPHSCIYCSKDVFKNRIFFRSAENVVKEIEFLIKRYGVRQIDILDDNFASNRGRVERICDLLIEGNHKVYINLQSGIRADSVDEKLMKKLRRAGVFKIAFGVETGDEAIMSKIKKRLDLNKVIEAAALARKNGIITVGFFMIGFPWDDESTLQKTIDFAKKMDPHIANFMMTIPFFGTELYRIVKEKCHLLIDTEDGVLFGFYSARPYFECDGLPADTILYYYNKAYRDFYFRIGKVYDILKTIKSLDEVKWFLSASLSTMFPGKTEKVKNEQRAG